MKKIFAIALLGFATLGYSQVIIGDDVGTIDKTKNGSVLLEFAKGNKGIILPYITDFTKVAQPTPGTLALDASKATKAKVVYYKGTSATEGEWIDLSSGETADLTALTPDPLGIQNNEPEASNAKAVIGNSNSTAKGVLVLESNTKAMVLPQVASTDNIVNPSAGMMVFVTNTKDKLLAVFNGSKWTFWKATN